MRFARIAACAVLLAGTAFADPFTGRYLIETLDDKGVSITGFIDFIGADTGTSAFRLADAAAFSIVASGPGLSTLTYDSLAMAFSDDIIQFDASLGSLVLAPSPSAELRRWQANGDLDGGADGEDSVSLRVFTNGQSEWAAWEDSVIGVADFFVVSTQPPPAWRLVLDQSRSTNQTAPVPEPGSLALAGAAVAGVLVWRRRRRTA